MDIKYLYEKLSNFNFGNEIFYCRPGQKIVLRADGSFGGPTSDNTMKVLDQREMDSGMFRIQRNHLICPQDEQW